MQSYAFPPLLHDLPAKLHFFEDKKADSTLFRGSIGIVLVEKTLTKSKKAGQCKWYEIEDVKGG